MSRHPLDCLSAAKPGVPLLSPKTPDYAPGKKSGAAFKTLTQAVKAAEACRNDAADCAREADRSAIAAAAAKNTAAQSAAHADSVCARAVLLCVVLAMFSVAPWVVYLLCRVFE